MTEGHTPWEGKTCPECGVGKILVRLNTKTNIQFYGCSAFPTCTASWDISELNEWEPEP